MLVVLVKMKKHGTPVAHLMPILCVNSVWGWHAFGKYKAKTQSVLNKESGLLVG